MKIFHGPQNIGGMAGTLAKAQRDLGVEAVSYCLPTGDFRYYSDFEIEATSIIGTSWAGYREALASDVLQFYFGESLTLFKLQDIVLWKALGKKLFFYFCGCDLRDSKYVIDTYKYSACKNCWPMGCSANREKAIEIAKKYADKILVSTPDLLEFIEGSVWLPQPIEMASFDSIRSGLCNEKINTGQNIIVAHAPSNRKIKGTQYIEKAISMLQQEKFAVELLLVENRPYEEAMKMCASADLVVDQLLIGAYGQYAVEMMALGKPVISYIRDDIQSFYPDDMPIISANPDTIYLVLKGILEHPESLNDHGLQGVSYVKRMHDSGMVAKTLLKLYEGAV